MDELFVDGLLLLTDLLLLLPFARLSLVVITVVIELSLSDESFALKLAFRSSISLIWPIEYK